MFQEQQSINALVVDWIDHLDQLPTDDPNRAVIAGRLAALTPRDQAANVDRSAEIEFLARGLLNAHDDGDRAAVNRAMDRLRRIFAAR